MTSDILWSIASNLLVVVVRFLSFVMLGRQLGPAQYGAYVGMYGILNPIGGFTFAGLRLAVLQRAMYDKHGLQDVANSYVTLALAQGAVGLVAAVVLGSFFIGELGLHTVAMYAVVELLLLATVEVAASVVQVSSSFVAATRVRISTQLVRTGTLALLFLTGALTIGRLAIALAVTCAAYTLYIVAFRLPREGINVRFSRPRTRDVIVASQLAATLFSSSVKEDADKTVLAASDMIRSAGIYGAGYRVLQFGAVPIRSVEGALFHRFLVSGANASEQQMRRALRYTVVVVGGSTALAVVLWMASGYLDVLLGRSFEEAETVVRWLTPVLPLTALNQGPANGLAGLGRLGLRGAVVGLAALLSLLLYIFLIPQFGWQGAAVATIIAEAFTAAALWVAFVVAYRQARLRDGTDVATSAGASETAPG